MDIESLRKICLSFENVTEDIKWENHLCFCVGGKMFVILGLDEAPVTASFKAGDEDFEILSNKAGLQPAPYLARYKWISIDDISRFDRNEWEEFAGKAYKLIAGKLKKPSEKSGNEKKEKPARKAIKKGTAIKKTKSITASAKKAAKRKLKNEKPRNRKKKK